MDLSPEFLKKFNNLDNKISKINNNKILINEFKIDCEENLLYPLPDIDYFTACYKKCFELLYGVRERKSKKFIEQNIKSLEDLSNNKKYSSFIDNLFKILDGGFNEIKKIFGRRFTSSHQMAFLLLAFFKKEDLLFIDIETKDLFFETQIITIGCGFFENNSFKTLHLTALNEEGEYEILNEFKRILNTKKALVTFNGKIFDINFIDIRMSYYSIENNISDYHNFDLYFFSKKAFKGLQKSFTLKELDKNILKRHRKNDINGKDVINYYNKFKMTGNLNFLKPIINHNREDIVSLALLLHKLISVWVTPQ